jgi:lipoprotein-anchoring transpeptidase ErfK/SrfK
MKSLLLLMSLLISFSSFSNVYDINPSELQSLPLTEKEARALGMIEVGEYQALQHKMQDQLNKINANLNDDERNKGRAKVVFIINEGDRTRKNPEGQTLKFYKDGNFLAKYEVSTGSRTEKTTTSGRKYIAVTPQGFFRPKRAYREYYSYTFFGGLMRYAVFFRGGVATHTTTSTHLLGQRASAGCVRMEEEDAYEVNNELLKIGEPHRNYRTEKICKNGVCYSRELYTNRYKLWDVGRWNAGMGAQKIWTYDALIIVKPGKK